MPVCLRLWDGGAVQWLCCAYTDVEASDSEDGAGMDALDELDADVRFPITYK